jgi:hypothetical protein
MVIVRFFLLVIYRTWQELPTQSTPYMTLGRLSGAHTEGLLKLALVWRRWARVALALDRYRVRVQIHTDSLGMRVGRWRETTGVTAVSNPRLAWTSPAPIINHLGVVSSRSRKMIARAPAVMAGLTLSL